MKYIERFGVAPGSKVKLTEADAGFTAHHESHKVAAQEMEKDRERLRELQELLYADARCSVLICLQGMDAGGEDGTIRHFLAAMTPQGCRVAQFRQPPTEELAHDFLWRFEKGLVESNVHILKFYLHLSKEEQLKRFADRLDEPSKQWKISESDYKERKLWGDYTAAYEEALSRCSTDHAPWFVVPSDHKWFRNLAIARIVVEHLEGLNMKFPEPSVDIAHIRREYHREKGG